MHRCTRKGIRTDTDLSILILSNALSLHPRIQNVFPHSIQNRFECIAVFIPFDPSLSFPGVVRGFRTLPGNCPSPANDDSQEGQHVGFHAFRPLSRYEHK